MIGDFTRLVTFTAIMLVAGLLPAVAGQQPEPTLVAAGSCDMAALARAQAEFDRLQALRQASPDAVSPAALRAASSDYIARSEQCYQALYSGSTLRIDDGAMTAGPDGALAQPFVTYGNKWGAGSPYTGGQDVGGPGIPGGTVSYSFMANGVSQTTEPADANLAVTSLTGFQACFLTRITTAFDAWSSVANIQFVQVTDNGLAYNAAGATGDIRIGAHTFDGPSGTLAHAFRPPPNGVSAAGDLHFDRQESWSCAPSAGTIDIGLVALHEIGHSIGLDHEPTKTAVMNPIYNAKLLSLQGDDITGAASIYGASPVLAFVVDDTGSMTEEIGAVRNSLTQTIDRLKADSATSGRPFPMTAIVTFKDDVTTRIVSNDPLKLQPVVNALVASGGGDCAESSNAALIVAGQMMAKGGVAMLFTDADSRPDGPDRPAVLGAFLPKALRLSVLLSGSCTEGLLRDAEGSVGASGLFSGPSDNHDVVWERTAPRDQRSRATSSLDSPGAVLGTESSVRTFLELSTETRGTFTAIPEVNTSAAGVTKYTNVATNLSVSAVLPAVSLVTPSAIPQGVTLTLEVTGANTNFQGSSAVSVSGTGVTVLSQTVLSATRLLVALSVSPGAATGFRDVIVTTNLGAGTIETALGGGSLQIITPSVSPTIVGILPSQVAQGATTSVVITGVNTHFVNGTTTVLLGAGVTVNSVSVSSATALTANITVAPTAAVGYRDVRATTGSETALETGVGPLLITAPPPVIPRLLTATPSFGTRGTILSVTLTAENTHFDATTTVVFSGTGIALNSVTVGSATSLVAVITIAPDAVLSFKDITVTTGSEIVVLLSGFNVRSSGANSGDDLDGDGKADLIWRQSQNGDVAVWLMNGGAVGSNSVVASGVPLVWQVAKAKDVNGDGRADLIWRNSQSGDVAVWLMNGGTVTAASLVAAGVPLQWQIAGAGDVNGDGRADLVWRNTTNGDVALWLMNGATVTPSPTVAAGVSLAWQIAAVGDVDGDGKADLMWRQTQTGDVSVWLMDGATVKQGSVIAAGVSLAWEIVSVGDLDGDGKLDLVWRQTQTGDVAAWLMNGATVKQGAVVASGVPLAWQVATVRDVDGDGRADLTWRNTTSGVVAVWLMDGVTVKAQPVIAPAVAPAWQILK